MAQKDITQALLLASLTFAGSLWIGNVWKKRIAKRLASLAPYFRPYLPEKTWKQTSEALTQASAEPLEIPDETCTAQLMLPDDANPAGNVHGGTILQLVEMAGWIASSRYVNTTSSSNAESTHIPLNCMTARIEHMDFREPCHIGDVVHCRAKVHFTTPHSIFVIVNVYAENAALKQMRHTNTAKLWYVAFPADQVTRPTRSIAPVPQVSIPSNPQDLAFFEMAASMYDQRKNYTPSSTSDILAETRELPSQFDPLEFPGISMDPNAPTIADSQSVLAQLMLPGDCVKGGAVRGGVIMKLMDSTAGVVAWRHCHTNVVTVSIEAMDFRKPVFAGYVVTITGRLTFMSARAMEIEVTVEAEDPTSGQPFVATRGYFKFVSLDRSGKSQMVPPVRLTSVEEYQRFLLGKARHEKSRARQRK